MLTNDRGVGRGPREKQGGWNKSSGRGDGRKSGLGCILEVETTELCEGRG